MAVWVFAALGQSDEQLFTASVRAAEQRVSEFSEQDLTYAAWVFATVG